MSGPTQDGTHDPGWKAPYELGEWPDDKDSEAWVKYALRLLANEVNCVINHVDRGERGEDHSDYFNAALHMGNLGTGIQETAAALFSELLNDEEKVSVTMYLMEKKLGIPMKLQDVGHGIMAIVPDNIVVPDDLTGLAGEGT